jgi:hypothetical protein
MRYFLHARSANHSAERQSPGRAAADYYANTNASIKLTTIVSNTLVNELRGSMQRNLARLTDTEIPGSTPRIWVSLLWSRALS